MATNLTPKQVRNGIASEAGEQNSPQPGPDATREITSTKRQAENAANQIAKRPSFGPPADGTGAHGDMWSWDAGLAINDVEGGGSG